MSTEILNPESKMGTLNPKTFEFRKFCRVNAFLLNLDMCDTTKMVDLAIHRNPKL